jgi:hypothetical protein
MNTAIVFRRPRNAAEVYPDGPRYKGGFGVRSQTTNDIYKISFDTACGWWACSCRGWIRWGQCKHLDAIGLKGRRYGQQETPKFLDGVG